MPGPHVSPDSIAGRASALRAAVRVLVDATAA